MSVPLTAPGVYVQELPSGARPITGVSTSLTAFVGPAPRGPLDTPTRVTSWAEFERTFGGLWTASTLSHTVRHYFLNGGSEALVVRVASSELLVLAATAAAQAAPGFHHLRSTVTHTGAATFDLQIACVDAAGTVVDDGDPYSVTVSLNTTAPDLAAIEAAQTAHPHPLVTATGTFPSSRPAAGSIDAAPGSPSVLRIGSGATSASAMVPVGFQLSPSAAVRAVQGFDHLVVTVANSDAAAGTFDLTIAAADAVGTTLTDPTDGDYAFSLTGLQVDTDYGRTIAAELTPGTGVRLVDVLHTPPPVVPPDGTVTSSAPDAPVLLASHLLVLEAASPGTWGNRLQAEAQYEDSSPAGFHLRVVERTPEGQVAAEEMFYDVSTDPVGAQWVQRVLEQRSALVRLASSGPATWLEDEPVVAFAGGADGGTPHVTTDVQGSEADRTGIYALLEADLFNLLCIPLDTWSTADAGEVALWGAAAQLCRDEQAVLLVDPPSEWATFAAAESGAAELTLRDRNAALYFPRIVTPNPLLQNRTSEFPPCGAVAGAIARTDAGRGVWKAPAGIDVNLFGVPQLALRLTDPQHGVLNQLGINCIRSFPVYGRILWGARTLDGADVLASEWKYLPVRRLALYIEESLRRGTRWAVFEPNDSPLWAQLRLSIGSFLASLFRQGAFQGSSASEAYFVKCDAETTTQADVDLGIVNIVVGFAPVRPAEFVVIKLQQISTRSGS